MYSLLSSSSTESAGHVSSDQQSYISKYTKPQLFLCICILCMIGNLALTLSFGSEPAAIEQAISRKDIDLLRRPSQFIRFDEIQRPTPPLPKHFNNYPTILTQIDQSDITKVFEDDPKRHLTHVGTISPEDRRVLVTSMISTIVQFRAIDFGMETCELRLSLSATFAELLMMPDQSFSVSVYWLGTSTPLDVTSLSYQTRPQRIAKVADVYFAFGNRTLWHHKFSCKREEMMTFELSCSTTLEDNACNLEWWQTKERPDPAVFMTQYSTI